MSTVATISPKIMSQLMPSQSGPPAIANGSSPPIVVSVVMAIGSSRTSPAFMRQRRNSARVSPMIGPEPSDALLLSAISLSANSR